MKATKNTYIPPIDSEYNPVMTYNRSPAHVGPLINSVDFIIPEGTPIRAAADGVVIEIKIDSNTGGPDKSFEEYGNYIEIKHEHGEYSEYEHLKQNGALVKVGDTVSQGQIIGYSGNTGWMAELGPHLHFMVGIYGKALDDYQTLIINWQGKQ